MEKINILGKVCQLTPIVLSDAEFICMLRNNPQNNRFLSSTDYITVDMQKKWLEKNSKTGDYYFKIYNIVKNVDVGTISLYNIHDNSAEFGRYICNDSICAIESVLLLLRFGFAKLGLNTIYCLTAVDNQKVWKQHIRFGFIDCGKEYLEQRGLELIKQIITRDIFVNYDYSRINNIIQNLKERL